MFELQLWLPDRRRYIKVKTLSTRQRGMKALRYASSAYPSHRYRLVGLHSSDVIAGRSSFIRSAGTRREMMSSWIKRGGKKTTGKARS